MGDLSFSIYGESAAVTGCSPEASGSLTIPDSFEDHPVTWIQGEAFAGCEDLTSVTIPDGVESIDFGAFYGCASLTSVTIPDSVTSIGNAAFEDCTSLTSASVPDGAAMGEDVFLGCSSLTP